MKPSHTAPFGIHRLASEFLSAGLKIQPVAASAAAEFTQPIAFVAYYLAGHSIELSLKAFLLSRGVPITALRKRPYGHNLAALLREARRRKLGRVAKLSRHDVAVVNLLNACYGTKEFEYVSIGYRRIPSYSDTVAVATRLQDGVGSYCRKLATNNSIQRTQARYAGARR